MFSIEELVGFSGSSRINLKAIWNFCLPGQESLGIVKEVSETSGIIGPVVMDSKLCR